MDLAPIIELLPEFQRSFLDTPKGQAHMTWFPEGRRTGHANFLDVVRRADAGEDVTDLVLERLLPHLDSPHNRERGSWTCIAPVVTRDIKPWFEGAGWARPDDWPAISQLLLGFFRRVVGNPNTLSSQCEAFRNSPLSKGFQAGFLSPLLNALNPELFCLVNSKTTRTLRQLAGATVRTNLRWYPQVNAATRSAIDGLGERLPSVDGVLPGDVFDAFCHWWVAIYKGATRSRTNTHAHTDPDEAFRKFYPDDATRSRLLTLLVACTH